MNRKYNTNTGPCCPGQLARACVPFQEMKEVYSPREALKKGTLFPELYKANSKNNRSRTGGRYYE